MATLSDRPTPDPAEAKVRGRGQRAVTVRGDLAEVGARPVGFDPVQVIVDQSVGRLASLVPIRYQRMLASPFSFLRGAAAIQARDLSRGPSTPIEVQLCGDAHLMNFGVFSSPERQLVFDVNDFDETAVGPFEWDLKRLVASFAVAGESNGLSAKQRERIVRAVVASYRVAMRRFAGESFLELWYESPDVSVLESVVASHFGDETQRRIDRAISRAKAKTAEKAFAKLVEVVNGRPQIKHDPPLLVPLADLSKPDDLARERAFLYELVDHYAATLPSDCEALVRRFTPVDAAMKVVGVGSVGTRCWIVLLFGRDGDDPFFLQVKEAGVSVIDQARGFTSAHEPGERVVRGQRLMQVDSDIFLGWYTLPGLDGVTRSFYVRQLYDNKASAIVEQMDAGTMAVYANACGWTLARAHARSGIAGEINGYCGTSSSFEDAIVAYADAYRVRNNEDHAAFQQAAAEGRITAAS